MAAIGGSPIEVLALGNTRVMLVYASEAEVLALRLNMSALMELETLGFIVTAPGTQSDFVSRFFAPKKGIPEDPVTGGAHTTLIPFWAEKLGRSKLVARQVSQRGGELYCQMAGDRVKIAGYGVPYMTGTIYIP